MASSNSAGEAQQVRRPNYSRRFMWLAAFIVLLFGGYSVAWFYVGGLLETRARDFIAAANTQGRTVECAAARAGGYPFRIGLFCDSLRYEQPGEFSVSAKALRSAAQVYNPFLIITEVDGPATLASPRAGGLDLDWDLLHASLRFNMDAPERISLETNGLVANATMLDGAALKLARVDHAEAHLRPNGADLDFAAAIDDAIVDPTLLQGGTLPPLDSTLDVTLKDGVAAINGGGDLVLGRSGVLHTLSLSTGDSALSASGPFSVDLDGLIDADLKIRAKKPETFGAILGAAFPSAREQMEQSLSGLAALGENAEVPLTIRKSQMTIGFVPLGAIAPLSVSQ